MKKKIAFIMFFFVILLSSCSMNDQTSNKTYTVSFETNMENKIDSTKTNQDGKIEEPSTLVREGYDFIGWYLDYELTIPFSFKYKINRDLTIYAKWEIKKINVNLFDGEEIVKNYEFNYGDILTEISEPNLTGRDCLGIYFDKEFNTIYDKSEEIVLKEDLNLYIKSKIKTLDITIFVDGLETEIYNCDYQTRITTVPIPKKDHYVFDGWYSDISYNNKLYDTKYFTSNMPIYGRFVLEEHTINYFDGDTLIGTKKKTYGTSINEGFDFTKDGYHFDGLYTSKEYTNKINDEDLITEDINVFVKWQINTYDVILYVDGILYKSLKMNHFDTVNLIERPTKEHYSFSGWYKDDSFKTAIGNDEIIVSPLVLYGRLVINQVKVSIYDNSTLLKSVSLNYGEKLEKIGTITKKGYTLENIYSDSALNNEISWTETITENINIYTKWNINIYQVTLIIDETTTDVVTRKYNTTILDYEEPVKEGYIFVGWFKDNKYTKPLESSGKITATTTLYAKWYKYDEVPYKVIYKVQNINDNNYSIYEQVTFYGTLNDIVNAEIRSYVGFTVVDTNVSGTILVDPILELEVLYTRDLFTLTIFIGDEVYLEKNDLRYGMNYNLPTNVQIEDAFFEGWYLDDTFTNQVTKLNNINRNYQIYAKYEQYEKGTEGLIYAINQNNNGYIVTGYEGNEPNILIPSGYNYLPVVEVQSLNKNQLIENVIISEKITKISKYVFAGCINLETINLPNSLEIIEDFAFLDCHNLKQISIKEKVNYIGTGAFYNCYMLESIEIAPTNLSYTSIDGVLYTKTLADLILYPSSKNYKSFDFPSAIINLSQAAITNNHYLETITTNNNLSKINAENFVNCDQLVEVTISKSVKAISDTTFINTKSLTNINVDSENAKYQSVDGILFNSDITKLIKFPSGKQIQTYLVPNTVKMIKYNAFYQCRYLKEVIINTNVQYLEEASFVSSDNNQIKIYSYHTDYQLTWHNNAIINSIIIFYPNWDYIDSKPQEVINNA